MSVIKNNITRQNYEEWFIDYLDGEMEQERECLLFDFLHDNADLKAELESFQSVVIPEPLLAEFPDKQHLYKTSVAGIDMSQADYLLIKKTEEGLSEDENIRLSELFYRFPDLKHDEQLYDKTRLLPALFVYGKKKSLYRKKAFWGWPLAQAIVAAAILLMILVPGYQSYKKNNSVSDFNKLAQSVTTPADVKDILPDKQEELHIKDVNIAEKAIQVGSERENSTTISQNIAITQSVPESETDKVFYDNIEQIDVITKPVAAIEVSSVQIEAYEKGLAKMIPTYITNKKLQDALEIVPDGQLTASAPDAEQHGNLFSRLSQKEIAFRKVYDSDGNVVAINVKSGDFQMSQRLPRLLRR